MSTTVDHPGAAGQGAAPDPECTVVRTRKLELLEEPSERLRLKRLCEILETVAAAVERQRAVAELAQRNGRPKPAGG